MRPLSRPQCLRLAPAAVCTLAIVAALPAPAQARAQRATASGSNLVVRFKHGVGATAATATLRAAGVTRAAAPVGGADVVAPRPEVSPTAALKRLVHARAVAWAERSLRAGSAYVPNDSGVASAAGPPAGWATVQWELNGPFGINAPQAWSQASRLGGSGGRGVKVAILDSGVAYASRGGFARSPDLSPSRFVGGYDFIDDDRYPNDEFGHGTFVASIVGATANNGYGTVGVAYRAQIMPVRVLDFEGKSDAATVARGVRFAVRQGADVINLSLELFDAPPLDPRPRSVMSSRTVRSALVAARSAGVVVVSATGNSFDREVPGERYDTLAINVGGTTEHGCLGGYSNHGPGMDLVAPGGGVDAPLVADPTCQPTQATGRDVSGVSFRSVAPRIFEMLPGFRGTSSAAPHVTGVAALVIASGVLGPHPRPGDVERHLERTAHDLGVPGHDRYYGWGLVDATAATRAPLVTPSG
ncbi:MAG TPA: S8 family serine peptidase [Solirubrobacteraceae bacterium]|nr:S8 family serine peptidase [Solirubrobacteraceae bacterium]